MKALTISLVTDALKDLSQLKRNRAAWKRIGLMSLGLYIFGWVVLLIDKLV